MPPPSDADDRGDGPAVVLLHGQPGTRRDWDAVVAALGDGFRLIVPDRPGYGSSAEPAGGIGFNGSFTASLLDRCGVDRAVIVGHSWGGAVALDVAQRHPDRVAGLVLVASVGGEGSVHEFDRVLGAPVVGPFLAFGGLLALSLPRVRRLLAPAEIADRLPASWVLSWRSFVVEQRSLTADIPAITAGLGSIDAAAEVVIGEGDRVVSPRSQEALATALPRSSVTRVPRVGHLVPWEAPSVVADAVRRVWAG